MSLGKKLRYLWAYSASDAWVDQWNQRLLALRQSSGYDVKGFCVTPASLQRQWLPFPELDRRWKAGNRALLNLYENLARALEDRDVLILYNGANLHPDFVRWLNVLKVYTAGDDPESTTILTQPLAPAFDIHLVNNIACVPMYQGWGLKEVHFWPLGSLVFEDDQADLNEENILQVDRRTIPVIFLGERASTWRQKRLERLAQTFPQAYCAGYGWPNGFISWQETWAAYRKAQIGWNVHNSSGPINFRTYELPAHGILQICDNRSHLAKIFTLDKEVVGFETLEECIDLTRYYLAHPEEQRQIALAGWKRWKQSYTPDQVWQRLVEIVEQHQVNTTSQQTPPPIEINSPPVQERLAQRYRETRLSSLLLEIRLFLKVGKRVKSLYAKIAQFFERLHSGKPR